MTFQSKLPRQTERARQRATHLRRNANGVAMLFRDENALGKLAVFERNQIASRSVRRIESAMDAQWQDVPFLGEFGPSGLRNIRHLFKCPDPPLIDRFENLGGSI